MIDILAKLIVSAMDKTPQIIKIINRFLAAVIVFLVPVILNTALSLLGEAGLQSTDCWINANEEHIKALQKYKNKKFLRRRQKQKILLDN